MYRQSEPIEGLDARLRLSPLSLDPRRYRTAANSPIAIDIIRTFAASFAVSESSDTAEASVVSAVRRAAPRCFSAASSARAIAVVRAGASPSFRTN